MIAIDVIKAHGHINVKATHRNTLEITKDNFLTTRGDCIIGIESNKSAYDLSSEVKELIKRGAYVYLVIKVKDKVEIIHGIGDPRLTLENKDKIIVRKSDFISDSTIMIRADKSAKDIRRDLIDELKSKETELIAYIVTSDSPLEDSEILRILVNRSPFPLS